MRLSTVEHASWPLGTCWSCCFWLLLGTDFGQITRCSHVSLIPRASINSEISVHPSTNNTSLCIHHHTSQQQWLLLNQRTRHKPSPKRGKDAEEQLHILLLPVGVVVMRMKKCKWIQGMRMRTIVQVHPRAQAALARARALDLVLAEEKGREREKDGLLTVL